MTLGALPAAAAQDEPPRFLIETIAVEGTRRASPETIAAVSLLEPGHSYSEVELREAVYRIVRLPFILAADLALRRGSERGKFELLVTVEETRRFFFGGDLTYTRFGQSLAFEGFSSSRNSLSTSHLAGMRFFVGQNGVLFAALGEDEAGIQVGYNHYNLFRRHIFFSLGYTATRACCTVTVSPLGLDPTASSWGRGDHSNRLGLTLGFPLRGNQSLRFNASFDEAKAGHRRDFIGSEDRFSPFFDHRDFSDRDLELAWIDDSTDDPVLPRVGMALTAAVDYRTLDAAMTRTDYVGDGLIPVQTPLPVMRTRLLRATFSGDRYWPLTGRQSLAAGMRIAVGRSQVRNAAFRDGLVRREALDVREGSVTVRHALSLLDGPRTRRWGELRWEQIVKYGYEGTSSDLALADNSIASLRVSSVLVFRNSWGVFRIGLSYLDVRSWT
ncbi:MAG: hypothetical protein GY856_49020 [bacterium]|nr:hypothetical protein [bacterium]